MCCCSHDFHHRKAKLFPFVPEKVSYNLVGIRVNPLTEDEDIQEKETVVKEGCPESAVIIARIVDPFFKDCFGEFEGRFSSAEKGLAGNRYLGKNIVVEVSDAFQSVHDDAREFLFASHRFIAKEK